MSPWLGESCQPLWPTHGHPCCFFPAHRQRGVKGCAHENTGHLQASASATNSGEAGRQENLATMLQEQLRAEERLPWSLESNSCSSTSVSRTPLNHGPGSGEAFPNREDSAEGC